MANTTYAQFKATILNALGATEGTTYSDELIYDAVRLASDAILPWVPNQKYVTLTSGSDAALALPGDCYQVDAVVDNYDSLVLERMTLSPGKRRRNSDSNLSTPYDWMEYPRGYINFTIAPTDPDSITIDENGISVAAVGREFTIYYQAYWSKPSSETDDAFVLPMPSAALNGMLYWACAHCMVPGSVTSAQIRQFNTKVDSGSPVDNTLEAMAKYLRAMFVEEMNRLPKYRGSAV
jgi:hypothetical protein